MSAHADILDRPDPLTKPFWTSMTLHVLLVGGLIGATVVEKKMRINMGSPTGGGLGVLVNPVASIPMPNRGGPENPVANDTKSELPTPPAPKVKAKPAPKEKALADALPLHSEKAPKRPPAEAASQPNKFREQQKDSANQLYSNAGQRMSTPNMSVQGGGGVRIGDSSPFGEQFGAYANIVRENIARNWKPANTGMRGASGAVITFTIHRDGTVTDAKIGKSSGNQTLDFSALRAVQSTQLPGLPYNFPRNQADVQLTFELGN